MHRLPKPRLVWLCIKTPSIRRVLREYRDKLSPADRVYHDAFRAACSVRLDRERPWRILNQRKRLYACHWAGWTPERTSKRWGAEGPKWLGK